jgi:dTDP-4-dehydrorhamnose 3,5-epimerase-like enzyme
LFFYPDRWDFQVSTQKAKSFICFAGNIIYVLAHCNANRKQSVVIDGSTSDVVSVDSGVLQGSVLGPGLFLYYINEMIISLGYILSHYKI